MTRPRRREAGQATLELVILVIPLLLLVYVAISLGRWAETKGVLADAANAAAEASAASPGGAAGGLGSQSAASQAASGVIGAHGLGCGSAGVSVTLAVNAGGTTTATVTCVAAASQASFPGLPGSLTLSVRHRHGDPVSIRILKGAPMGQKRVQISMDDDTAIVLGVVATADGTTQSDVVARALQRYLSGRLRHPGIARAASSLGSKMPAAVLERRRAKSEAGSFTLFAALVVLALFAIIGLAIDGGRMLAAHSTVSGDAYVAASAAAQAATGDESQAAESALASEGMTFDGLVAQPTGGWCVTAQQTENTAVLGIMGINRFTARATSCSTVAR